MTGNFTYVAAKKLQNEGGDAAVDSYQDVHAGQNHVGRAGDLEEERGRVHQRGDGPAGRRHGDDFRGEEGEETEEKRRNQTGVLCENQPVEEQQQSQHGQVGGGDVGFLLETHKDDDDQRCRDDVVTL